MASPALERQIAAFERMLPQLRADHGSAWALVADEKLQGAFKSFQEAATYADRHLRGTQVLIRSTAGYPVTLPFVMVEAG